MNSLRVLIIGCGSIGSRRARILADMGHDLWLVDNDAREWGLTEKLLHSPGRAEELAREVCPEWDPDDPCLSFTSLDQMHSFVRRDDRAEVPDAAFICTPPETHVHLAEEATKYNPEAAIFIEKPLAPDHEEATWMGYPNRVTMGACNMRFDERVQSHEGPIRDAHHVIFRMGQHADYWSDDHEPIPMALDSIHELDLALALRGPATDVRGFSTENHAQIEVTHQDRKTSFIHLDRETDPPERYIRLSDRRKIDLWPPDDEMYRREMEHFLTCVEQGVETCNSLGDTAETLRWALRVAEKDNSTTGAVL